MPTTSRSPSRIPRRTRSRKNPEVVKPPAAPSFPPCRKRWGRKGALGVRLVHSASEFRREPMFQASFHTIVTLRASYYAPPDTGVPNLQLVSVEYLPSIEGALEIQMNVTFLRGKAPLPGADSPYQGEMSRRDKRGRDAVSAQPRLRGCCKFATAGCLRRPYLFSRKRKDMEEKSAWGRGVLPASEFRQGPMFWSGVPLGTHLTGVLVRAA